MFKKKDVNSLGNSEALEAFPSSFFLLFLSFLLSLSLFFLSSFTSFLLFLFFSSSFFFLFLAVACFLSYFLLFPKNLFPIFFITNLALPIPYQHISEKQKSGLASASTLSILLAHVSLHLAENIRSFSPIGPIHNLKIN